MEAKFGPLEKGIKTIDITWDEIFQKNSWVHPFLTTEIMRKFLGIENRISLWETKKIQIKLATTCNKNEQQDAKSNAEF